jgi:multicomponent Na+:H+ antiporter subunit D
VMNGLGGSYSLRTLSGLYTSYPLITVFALLMMLAVAGLPPASGLWPKVMLVRAALDMGQGWLAFAILLTGFLTTLALGRMFILAIWRPKADAGPVVAATSPALGYVTLAVLALPVLLMGVYPQPVIDLSERAASGILDASGYIGAVFPAEAQP